MSCHYNCVTGFSSNILNFSFGCFCWSCWLFVTRQKNSSSLKERTNTVVEEVSSSAAASASEQKHMPDVFVKWVWNKQFNNFFSFLLSFRNKWIVVSMCVCVCVCFSSVCQWCEWLNAVSENEEDISCRNIFHLYMHKYLHRHSCDNF